MQTPEASPTDAGYRQARRRADRLVLAYVVLSLLWIPVTDRAVEVLIDDPSLRALAATAKGWVFVAVTAALLHGLLRRWTAAMQALRRRELADRHLLEAIADHSSDAISAKDRAGRYLFANPAARHWLGRDAGALIGRDDEGIFPPEQVERLNAVDRAILADGQTRTRELQLDTALGRRVFLSTRGALRDAAGAVVGVFGISRDITERQQAEETLRDREHKLRAIVVHSPSALSLKDREGRYVLANPNMQRLLRRDEEGILGRTDAQLFPAEVAAELRANDARVLDSLEHHAVEETLPVDGEPRWFMSHLFPVLDDAGAALYVGRIALDVTERRHAEEALRARNEELERFNRAMVGRELDMIELKRQVNALSQALGRPAPYPLQFDAPGDAAAAGPGGPRP